MEEILLSENVIRVFHKGQGYHVGYRLIRKTHINDIPKVDFDPYDLKDNDQIELKMCGIRVFTGYLFTANDEPSLNVYLDNYRMTTLHSDMQKNYDDFAECCIRGILNWEFYNERMPEPIIGDTEEEMKQRIFVDPSYATLALHKMRETSYEEKFKPLFTKDMVIRWLR